MRATSAGPYTSPKLHPTASRANAWRLPTVHRACCSASIRLSYWVITNRAFWPSFSPDYLRITAVTVKRGRPSDRAYPADLRDIVIATTAARVNAALIFHAASQPFRRHDADRPADQKRHPQRVLKRSSNNHHRPGKSLVAGVDDHRVLREPTTVTPPFAQVDIRDEIQRG